MKKVIAKDNSGNELPYFTTQEDPSVWIAKCIASNIWGKPERQVLHKDEQNAEPYDDADVLEEIVIVDVPAIEEIVVSKGSPHVDAVMNDAGEIIQEEIPANLPVIIPAVPAITHKEVKLRAEYTIEIIDITAQVEQEKTNAEALAYLASTDWMVIREMDSGVVCPADIKAARAAARAKIVR